jgi:hypothetical protein
VLPINQAADTTGLAPWLQRMQIIERPGPVLLQES